MEQSELKPMLMITNIAGRPQEFLKVSTIYSHGFTVKVEVPIPPRTTVRTIRFGELSGYRPLDDAEYRKYNRIWDEANGKTRRAAR